MVKLYLESHFNWLSMKWSSFVFGGLTFFAVQSIAFTILYPGSFDPFHRSHFEEAVGIVKLTGADRVVILPIDEAYYNEVGGVKRPFFFDDELRAAILFNVTKDNPRLTVSAALSRISKDVFEAIEKVILEFRDPNVAILIGTDVLVRWKSLNGFNRFVSRTPLYINRDPREPKEFEELERVHGKERNLNFVQLPVTGIRGGDVKSSLIHSGGSNLAGLLPPGNEHFVSQNLNGIQEGLTRYVASLKPFARAALRTVLTQSQNAITSYPKIRALLLKDPYVADFFMITNWGSEISRTNFLAMLDAKLGISLYERLRQGPPEWEPALLNLGNSSVKRQSEFLRRIGFNEQSYVLNINPMSQVPFQDKNATSLYHWTTEKKARRIDMGLETSTLSAMKFVHKHQYLGLAFPHLVGRRAFYASEDPFGSMFNSREEVYAASEDGAPPILYRLKISSKAKIHILESNLVGKKVVGRSKNIGFDLDIVVHRHFREDGILSFEERVILNPQVILSVEKNPTDEMDRAREILDRIDRNKTRGLKVTTMDGKRHDWVFMARLLRSYIEDTDKSRLARKENCAPTLGYKVGER